MNWRPYPKYKDSGTNWLGQIPKHWEIQRLKWVLSIISGSTPSSGVPEHWDGEIPWVTPSDLGKLRADTITSTERSITQEGYQSCGTTMVSGGSLVLSTRAPIGHLAIAGTDLCTNQGCKALVFRKNDSDRYFYYQLLAGRAELQSHGCGSTFQELGRDALASVSLVRPPVSEQRAIAAFLDRETERIDTLIAKKERQIELLREKRAALISHAVTKGLDPNAPMKDSGVEWLGKIPAHWEAKKIKRLSKVRRGASPRPIDDPVYFDDEGEYAWVRISDVTASTKYLLKTEQILSKLGKSKSVPLEPGEVFLSIAATVGKPIITQIKCCIHDGFVYFIGLEQHREYLFYLFSGGGLYQGLGKQGTQLNLNTETIGDIQIPLPPFHEQRAIAAFLDREAGRIDALVGKVQGSIETLREYRTALISAAVTGKIDVRQEGGDGF